jgi:hypothetical protein
VPRAGIVAGVIFYKKKNDTHSEGLESSLPTSPLSDHPGSTTLSVSQPSNPAELPPNPLLASASGGGGVAAAVAMV